MLAQPGLTRAKALTHASAKWEWVAQALPAGRHVVRLSYTLGSPDEDPSGHALVDASALLGVALTPQQVVAQSCHVWPDAAPGTPLQGLPEGIHAVGAAAGLTGLAAIIAQAGQADFVSRA